MENLLNKPFRTAACLLAGMLLANSASAQRLLTEDFDYPAGNLYGQGPWWVYSSNSASPIQVTEPSLSYPGYQEKAVGNAAILTNTEIVGQDLVAKFTEGSNVINSGAIYYSALIKVTDVSAMESQTNFALAFIQKVSASTDVSDGKAGSEFAKLFIAKGSSDQKFKMGVERYSLSPAYSETEYDVNTTYLVIVKYEFINGDYNDEVSLFVNPASTTTEPNADAVFNGTSGMDSSRGFQGIELRQGRTANKPAPALVIDALRVAQSYANLFSSSATPIETPTITLSKKAIGYNYAYIGETYTETLNIKAKNLTGDITVGGLTTGDVTVSTTAITKEEAESENGFDLTVTLTPSSADLYMDEITFDSEGAAQQKASIYWSAVQLEPVADLKTLSGKSPEDYGTYKYTGEAVVTFVDGKNYYVQDASGAIRINDSFNDFATQPAIGDKITGFLCTVENSFGIYALPASQSPITIVASGQTVEPAVVTLAELQTNASQYFNSLVKVENVSFTEIAGQTITASMTSPAISDASGSGRMKLFANTDIIGSTAPSEPVHITGISTSTGSPVIGPRSLADITEAIAKEPSLQITSTMLFEGTAAPLNVATPLVKYTIKAENLPGAVSVYMTGANSNMFTLSTEEIPSGTSTTDITVTYTPTAIAKHTARINFDCAAAPELYQAFTLNTVCIDPENPPAVTFDASALTAFSAKVGETQEQTITITTANLPDYGKVTVKGESNGAFRINNTMLLKNGSNIVKVTFAPTAEGSFAERLEITALETETQYIRLSGSTTGGQDPEDKEGDNLPLSTENPRTLLIETFEGIENNKPLAIDGWKNIAATGKRAWWGYEFKEEDAVTEKAAKVTAYDSFVAEGEETPCEILLITPPLDFKNATSRLFTFRVMGDLMLEGQTDLLELCVVTLEGEEPSFQPIEPTMPCIADENKEWMEYHINLTNQQLPDVFFMGFRFKSTRGKANAATYYIDDVTYGRTDIPTLTPSLTQLEFDAVINTDYVSEPIAVSTANTTEPITLSVGGANKGSFELTANELPASGGSFSVKFKGDQEGIYEAYIKLSSRGAADVYIPVIANNKKESGIASILFSETPDITVFDLSGRAVKFVPQCSSYRQTTGNLQSGTYILRAVSASGTRTAKVHIP